jgi:hypothetical protein
VFLANTDKHDLMEAGAPAETSGDSQAERDLKDSGIG